MEKPFSLDEARSELKLFCQNFAASSNSDEFAFSTKDSSLKRVTSLVRKLKTISSENSSSLEKEIHQINCAMHFTEISASILENRPKNSLEYLSIVRVVVSLMHDEPEFRYIFDKELLKAISTLIDSGINPLDKYSNSYSSFRFFFRLALELQAVHASDNKFNSLSPALQKMLSIEEEKAKEFIPFVTYILKNFKAYISLSTLCKDKLFHSLFEVTSTFFKTMARYNLRLVKNFKSTESRARSTYEQRSDLSSCFESELIAAYESFISLRSSLEGLSPLLEIPMPNFENSEAQFIIDDGKVIFKSEIEVETDLYQDEDERSFYEDLPAFSGERNFDASPDEWNTVDDVDENCIAEVDPDAIGSSKNTLPKGIESFFKQVDQIVSIADVDKLSEKIISAGQNLKIIKYFEMFFEIARRKNELIKYIARLLASIKAIHPMVIQNVVESILGQFRFLIFKKLPLLRTRRRICSFIGELTKFRLMPQSASFNCLKMCLRDFTGPNIDMTSFLLEQSGRFLYLQPESHARMKNLISVIRKFRRNSIHIPNDKNILLGYAIFCVIKTHNVNFNIEPDFMESFYSFAFGRIESVEGFVEFFESLDWDVASESIKILKLAIIQVSGMEVGQFDIFASALQSLKMNHSEFVCSIIDMLICQSVLDLKIFDFFNFQISLKRIQLIGKLYYRGLVSNDVFFGYLYQAITLGHTLEGSYDDEPDNLSRVRMILTLLDSLKELRFVPSFYDYMKEFISMFRCYLASKNDLGKELNEFAIDVYKAFDNAPLEPINQDAAIRDFSSFPVYSLFKDKLKYLQTTMDNLNRTSTSKEQELLRAASEKLAEQNISELDREMSRIIGQDLESRKLEQKQNSDIHLPYSGMLQSPSNGSKNILLKTKKKKFVVKPLLNE